MCACVCTHEERTTRHTKGARPRAPTGLQKVPLPQAGQEGLASLGLRSRPSCQSGGTKLPCAALGLPQKLEKPDLKEPGCFQGASWFPEPSARTFRKRSTTGPNSRSLSVTQPEIRQHAREWEDTTRVRRKGGQATHQSISAGSERAPKETVCYKRTLVCRVKV